MDEEAWNMVDADLNNMFRAATLAAKKKPCMLRLIEHYASEASLGENIQLVDILDVAMLPQDRCVTFEVGLVRWEALNMYDGYASENDVTLQCENDMEDFFFDVEEFIRVPMVFLGASRQKKMSRWKLLQEIKVSANFIPKNTILFLPYDSTMLHKLGFWADDIISFNNNFFKEEHETFEAAALLSMSSK